MANSIDPDETAHYEPSHLDLHCLHIYRFWSAKLKGLKTPTLFSLLALYQKYHFFFFVFVCLFFLFVVVSKSNMFSLISLWKGLSNENL